MRGPPRRWRSGQDEPAILAGRDLSARGTWLAVDRQRRFGIITNFRDLQARRPDAPSRGGLIPDWLRQAMLAGTYLEQLEAEAQRYAGFNLLLNDADRLYYASNRAPKFSRLLEPGVYGLSNLLLDTPWPKLTRVREKFEQWLACSPATAGCAAPGGKRTLFAMLADRTRSLPDAASRRAAAAGRMGRSAVLPVRGASLVRHPLLDSGDDRLRRLAVPAGTAL